MPRRVTRIFVALAIACSAAFMTSGCGCTNTVVGAAGGEILTCGL